MGRPKGLLPYPGSEPGTFLGRIADRYHRFGFGGVVVCTEKLAPHHVQALGNELGFAVVAGPPGGDTWLTLCLGWQAVQSDGTHLWAHPVDMPLVKESTLAELLAVSQAQPTAVVRPTCNGQPGHPVIVPTATMAALAAQGTSQAAAVREVLGAVQFREQVGTPVLVPVADEGVVTDFDEPQDLQNS